MMPDVVWARMKYTHDIHAFTRAALDTMDQIINGWDGPREGKEAPICGCCHFSKFDIKETISELPASRNRVCKGCLKKMEAE